MQNYKYKMAKKKIKRKAKGGGGTFSFCRWGRGTTALEYTATKWPEFVRAAAICH
jgi:hypothetical protein